MKYSIYTTCARHIRKISFSDGTIELCWVKNPNGGTRFHFSNSLKYWAMPYSWAIISNIFGYNITLTLYDR